MAPLPTAEEVQDDLRPFLPFFRDVPREAWVRALREGPPWCDSTSRKNLAWNAMNMIGEQKADEFGLKLVTFRKGRPLLCYEATTETRTYLIRLNCLSDGLQASGIHTYQRSLWEESPDYQPTFKGMDPPLTLRGGFVLDKLGIAVIRTPIVLSRDDKAVWGFDIPESDAKVGGGVVPIRPEEEGVGTNKTAAKMSSTKAKRDVRKDNPAGQGA